MDTEEQESAYINSNLLITEVKKRRLLYDCYTDDYKDRAKKAKSWEEVAAAVIFEWDQMTPREKTYKSKEVQVRWRSIRDAFIKDYKAQTVRSKDPSKPVANKQKKRYVFYDRLLFLVPVLNKRKILESGVNVFGDDSLNNFVLPESFPEVQADNSNGASEGTSPSSNDVIIKPFQKAHRNRQCRNRPLNSSTIPAEAGTSHGSVENAFENELISILRQNKNDNVVKEDDGDRLFLLSLLPEFKKMNDDVKFDTRIEILQVIKKNSKLSAQQTDFIEEEPFNSDVGFQMKLVEGTMNNEDNEDSSQHEDGLSFNSDCVDTEF